MINKLAVKQADGTFINYNFEKRPSSNSGFLIIGNSNFGATENECDLLSNYGIGSVIENDTTFQNIGQAIYNSLLDSDSSNGTAYFLRGEYPLFNNLYLKNSSNLNIKGISFIGVSRDYCILSNVNNNITIVEDAEAIYFKNLTLPPMKFNICQDVIIENCRYSNLEFSNCFNVKIMSNIGEDIHFNDCTMINIKNNIFGKGVLSKKIIHFLNNSSNIIVKDNMFLTKTENCINLDDTVTKNIIIKDNFQ